MVEKVIEEDCNVEKEWKKEFWMGDARITHVKGILELEPKINYRKLFWICQIHEMRDDLNLGCFHVSAVEELILQNGSEHSVKYCNICNQQPSPPCQRKLFWQKRWWYAQKWHCSGTHITFRAFWFKNLILQTIKRWIS